MRTIATMVGMGLLLGVGVNPVVAQAYRGDHVPPSVERAVDLPAQQLPDSLSALASMMHANIIYDPAAVAGKRARSLHGRYSLNGALKALLKGTPLTFKFTSESTVVVKPVQSAPKADPGNKSQQKRTPDEARALRGVTVVGHASALSATRSKTALKDIPQSVSVISRETLNQQNATDLASALRYAPGFRLEKNNSQQSDIYSRGYRVSSIHIDGGAPVQVVKGTINAVDATARNLAEYEGIEVLRGSDALYGGMGNPSATVSLNRKAPTPFFQAKYDVSIGSWNRRRLSVDVSGPMSSALSGRMVVSGGSRDYYYDTAYRRDGMIYGVLRYVFNASTRLDVGGSLEKTRGVNNFVALPRYDNGKDAHLPRSLALTTPWATVKSTYTEAFAKLQHDFNDQWHLRTNATFLKQDMPRDRNARYKGPIDSSTGLIPGPITAAIDTMHNAQKMLDATLTGSFDWLGYEQRVMVGGDYEISSYDAVMVTPKMDGPPIDPFHYDPARYPLPDDLSPESLKSKLVWHNRNRQWGVYGAFRLQPMAHLKIIVGGRESGYSKKHHGQMMLFGKTYAPSYRAYSETGKFTPYAGVTYELGENYTIYASYADIYHTNSGLIDKNHEQLPPSDGVNLEAGVKGAWNHGTLNASFAVFRIKQSGLATTDLSVPRSGVCCYTTAYSKSEGFEAMLSGALTDQWEITAGYTHNNRTYETSYYIAQKPKNLFKLWTNYQFEAGEWSLGGGVRTTSVSQYGTCAEYASGECQKFTRYGQGSYAVADLRVAYAFGSHWSAALNVNNLFDRVYYSTIGTLSVGNWYGAPRNFMLKISGRF